MKIKGYLRTILSILLLWQVWTHSHWSVALSITLTALSLEVTNDNIIKIYNKVIEILNLVKGVK